MTDADIRTLISEFMSLKFAATGGVQQNCNFTPNSPECLDAGTCKAPFNRTFERFVNRTPKDVEIECINAAMKKYPTEETPQQQEASLNVVFRTATLCDIESVKSLETDELFGEGNFFHLIARSYLPLVKSNQANDILGFIVLNDWPNEPYMPSLDWEKSISERYGLDLFTSQNTLFLHYLAWDKNTNISTGDFIETFIYGVFAHDRNIDYILLMAPWKRPIPKFCEIFKNVFDVFKDTDFFFSREEIKEHYDLPTSQLLVVSRAQFFAKLVSFDEDILTESVSSLDPYPLKDLNLAELEDTYDTFPFYGLRNATKQDTWFKVFQGKKEFQKFTKRFLQESSRLLIEPWSQRVDTSKDMFGDLTEHFATSVDTTEFYLETFNVIGRNVTEAEEEEEEVLSSSSEDTHESMESVQESAEKDGVEGGGVGKSEKHQKGCRFSFSNVIRRCKLPLDFHGTPIVMEFNEDIPLEGLQLKTLRQCFEAEANISYLVCNACNITAPRINPLNRYFMKVGKLKEGSDYRRSLYVCHRLSILGKAEIREMQMGDFEKVVKMIWNHPSRAAIQKDVLNSFKKADTRDLKYENNIIFKSVNTQCLKSIIFTCSDSIVGFAIVKPHYDMDFIVTYYKIEEYTDVGCHSVEGHGFAKHFLLNPLFSHLARYFMRAVMRLCGWTTLIASLERTKMSSGEWTVDAIDEWLPLQPRRVAVCMSVVGKDWAKMAPLLMTYHISTEPKHYFTQRVVVVGSGDLTLSFLENVLLSRYQRTLGFRDMVVICKEPILHQKFPPGYDEIVESMGVSYGKYNQEWIQRCGFHNRIRVIDGRFHTVDRERKLCILKDGEKISFDFLFLFPGNEFTLPKPAPHKTRRKIEEIQSDECPVNVFTLNGPLETFKSLCILEDLPRRIKTVEEAKYVIWGCNIAAFCCVTGLLVAGIPGEEISFFINKEDEDEDEDSTSYIHSQEIYQAVCHKMRREGVNIYEDSTFLKWDVVTLNNKKYVNRVNFRSSSLRVFLKVIAFYSFNKRQVNARVLKACKCAGLWCHKKLYINSSFQTSDKNIYAGGPLTSYSTIYKTDAYNHEYYNPTEIGTEIAETFWKRLISLEEEGNSEESQSLSEIVAFTTPLRVTCTLPGGWKYGRITKPGKEVVTKTINESDAIFLQTGDAYDENGPGLFQLIIDKYGIVREITCYRKQDIPISDLINIYGKHETLLNNLLTRYRGERISNFYDYFAQPALLYLYNERFEQFYLGIQSTYFENLHISDQGTNFHDVVAYYLNFGKWDKMEEEDRVALEHLFTWHPTLKDFVEKKLIEFIENNYVLPITRARNLLREEFDIKYVRSRLLTDHKLDKDFKYIDLPNRPIKNVVPMIVPERATDEKRLGVNTKTVDIRAQERQVSDISDWERFASGEEEEERYDTNISILESFDEKNISKEREMPKFMIDLDNFKYEEILKKKFDTFKKEDVTEKDCPSTSQESEIISDDKK